MISQDGKRKKMHGGVDAIFAYSDARAHVSHPYEREKGVGVIESAENDAANVGA